jgi:hypothetical protein
MTDVTIDADLLFFAIDDHPPKSGPSPGEIKN